MKHKSKKTLGILCIAAAICLFAGAKPVDAASDMVQPEHLVIGGEQVTEDHLSGSGWSYDPQYNRLTLRDYVYEGEGFSFGEDAKAGIYSDGSLDICLEGDSSLTVTDGGTENTGIHIIGELTFLGDGHLTVRAGKARSDQGVSTGIRCTSEGMISRYVISELSLLQEADVSVYGGSASGTSVGVCCDEYVYLGNQAHLMAAGGAAPTSFGIQAYRIMARETASVECYSDRTAGVPIPSDCTAPASIADTASFVEGLSSLEEGDYLLKESAAVESGTCGEQLRWFVTENGELVICGSGAMDDYTGVNTNQQAPWNDVQERIKEIAVLDGVASIGSHAFDGLKKHSVLSISIADSVESIGRQSFQAILGEGSHLKVDLPSGLKYIGKAAFADNPGLCGKLVIPEGVRVIEEAAFEGNSGMTSILLAGPVDEIGPFTFAQCSGLKTADFSGGVKEIRSNAFRGCDQLEYIRMPDDLAVLGDSAFEGCRELSEVSFDGNAPSIGQDVFRSCGSHMVLTYQKAKGGWSTPQWQGYASYPVHIHDQSGEIIKEASVEEDGRVDAVCSVCGKWTRRSVIDRIDPDSLTCQDELTYTGKAQYPKVTIADAQEKILEEGTDYSLEYSGNVNAGTGTVRVIFQGRYTGTLTREFTIKPKDLSQAAILLSQSSYTFDGKAKQPAVTISGLSGSTDYTVTYKNNTNAGTATVNASGKGNYCGTASATFRIAPAGISGWSISLSAASYAYTGTVRKPIVRITGIQAEDYLVKYSNASSKNVGTYTVTVSGRRNYTGSRSLTYTIKPKATSISSLTAASKAFTVKWKKVSAQATGYQIQYSTSSTFASGNKTVNITSYKTVSKKVTSLKASKKYYVRVRTYKTVGTKTYYSAWSAKKGITTKQ